MPLLQLACLPACPLQLQLQPQLLACQAAGDLGLGSSDDRQG